MNGQQAAILLRMAQAPERWYKRSELHGNANMRRDLDRLVVDRVLETHERVETLGTGLKVAVTLYRLAPPYRTREQIREKIGA